MKSQHYKTLNGDVVFFQDLKEQHHASRARAHDIVLLDGLEDSPEAGDLCQEIADDINLQRGII